VDADIVSLFLFGTKTKWISPTSNCTCYCCDNDKAKKINGFRGKTFRGFHSGIFGFDDFEKTQKATIFLVTSLQTVARHIKMKTLRQWLVSNPSQTTLQHEQGNVLFSSPPPRLNMPGEQQAVRYKKNSPTFSVLPIFIQPWRLLHSCEKPDSLGLSLSTKHLQLLMACVTLMASFCEGFF